MKGVFARNFEERSLKVPDSSLVGLKGPTVGITVGKHRDSPPPLPTAQPKLIRISPGYPNIERCRL